MPTYNYAFGGYKAAVPGFGQRWALIFLGTWAQAETFQVPTASTAGPLEFGENAFGALNELVCFTFRNREYVSLGSYFIGSDSLLDNPTGFESEAENAGAVKIKYLSQFGAQDTVKAFGQLQGRLAVFGRRTIQLWNVDADPNNFSQAQVLDNIGTQFPMSVKNIGDYDVLFVDDTGIRSLRSREVTLNAVVDDIGSPVDMLVVDALAANGNAPVAGIVEPKTKDYWVNINGQIFVLARHPASKISAWSIYEPRDQNNTLFVPAKMVVYNGQVFMRTVANTLIAYGGANNATYDIYSQVSFQLPWLNDKRPDTNKVWTAYEAIIAGRWSIQFAYDPISGTFAAADTFGSATTPISTVDSTYDTGRKKLTGTSTHITMKAVSSNTSTTTPAIFSQVAIHYNLADVH